MNAGEMVRGSFHAVTGCLLFAMAGWNGMMFTESKRPRHAVNAALYLVGTGYELYNTWLHWRAS